MTKHTGNGPVVPGEATRTSLVEYHKPGELSELMNFDLPSSGQGKAGWLLTVEQLLKYSENQNS